MKYLYAAQPKTLSAYNYFLIYFASLVILFTSLLTTFFLWQRAEFQIASDAEHNFNTKVNDIEISLKDTAQLQTDSLYDSVRSSFARGNFSSSLEWNQFVDNLQQGQFPGIESVSYVARVTPDKQQAFESAVKKQEKKFGTFYENFSISPGGQRSEYYVMQFVSPLAGNEDQLGSDLLMNTAAAKAMIEARDTGKPVRSFESSSQAQPGSEFVMYFPIYKNSDMTAASLTGFVRVLYSSDRFFAGLLTNPNDRENINIQVFDKNTVTKQKVFVSLSVPTAVTSPSSDLFTSDGIMPVGQKFFEIQYTAPKDQALGATQRNLEVYVILFGCLLSFLITTIFYLLATSRTRALILADHITRELNLEKTTLEQERAKLEIILQSIADGVFVVNEKSQVVLLNRVAQQYLDMPATEALNKSYCDAFHFVWERNTQAHCPKFVEEVIKTGVTRKLEDRYVLVRKDETRTPIEASASPIKNDDGKVIGCVVVVRDVTRERKIEDDKDNFLSIAAHQLKTPLGSMRWNLEMLLSGEYGKIPAYLVNSIQQLFENNQRMIKLVSDFLNVSRINQHRVKDEPTSTDLGAVIKSVVQEMRPSIRKKGLDVELKLESIPDVMIDPKRWKEVVFNLLNNAMQYSFYQGKITVSLQKKDHQLEMSVADQGMGISHRDQLKIFSKFFRGENALHSEADGSGLGLFVVKSYIEAWGGKISFESKIGKGTTFSLTLPLQPKRYIVDGVVTE